MKKGAFFVWVIMLFTSVADSQILNETFAAAFPPANWTRFLNNAASISGFNNWTSVTVNFPPATTDYGAFASGQGPGSVNVSEKYLVTPLLKPQAGNDTLFFKLKRAGTPVPLYANYLVKVSTVSNNTVSDFTTVATFTEGFNSNITTTFQTLSVDLSAYNNQDIYVAFVWSGNGDNGCYLDDVSGIMLSGGIFPLQLINFTATPQQNEVMLRWNVAGQSLQTRFEIEHSKNGLQWNKIAQLDQVLPEYGFIHHSPFLGRNYYRLVQKETGGAVTYSPARYIFVGTKGQGNASIYPNPIQSNITLDLGYTPTEPIAYKLVDLQGKLLKSGVVYQQQQILKTEKLSKGNYILNLADGQSIKLSKN